MSADDADEQVRVEDPMPEKVDSEVAEEAKIDTQSKDDPTGSTPPPTPPPKVENGEDSAPVKHEDPTPTENGTQDEAPASRPADPRLVVPRKTPATPSSDPRSPSSTSSLLGNTTFESGASGRPGYPGPTVGLPEGISVPNRVDSKLLQGRLLDTLKQLPTDLITDALNEYDDALQNKGGSIRNQGAYLYGVIKRYVNVQERAASGNADNVMGKELTPLVTEKLDKLVSDGFCSQEEMNDKVKSKIRMLSEKDALFAIDELSSVERGSIRNFSSYFMGILNRYMRGDTSTGGPARPRRDDHRSRSRFDDPRFPDRNDRYRGRSPDRDRDYRRRDDRYGDSRGDPRYRRDRSRDRYDDDRGRGDYGRHDSSRSYRDPRDPRNRFDDRNRSAPYNQYGGGAPPPPPPRQQQQQPQQTMNAYAPQPPQQQQQPPQQMFMAPNQQQQQPQQQVFQQQMPQQFVPQQQQGALGMPGSSFVPQQQTMMPQQPSQMGQQPFMTNMQQPQQQQQPIMTNMQPQQQQPPMQQQTSYQPPQQQSTPSIPADILGLADKAASAVASLQASRSMTAAPVVNMGVPQQQQMMHIPIQGQTFSSFSNPAPPFRARGRTTATMSELPVMVQYAVQNLQATGHVDGTLDEGILGMINELPEPLALGALQRFASIDTSTMRNKTAYLAGVLRRELEKNNQR